MALLFVSHIVSSLGDQRKLVECFYLPILGTNHTSKGTVSAYCHVHTLVSCGENYSLLAYLDYWKPRVRYLCMVDFEFE